METKLSKILVAFLDTNYQHAAWVTDDGGSTIAKNLIANNITDKHLNSKSKIITISGKNYFHNTKELNHGTNCLLHELIDPEVSNENINVTLDRLATTISKRTANI
jgi:hypothetical protein